MKQYKILLIGETEKETEDMINNYAKDGWAVICSYGYHNYWLILEKEMPVF